MISDEIKRLRQSFGISQTELGKRMGVRQSTVAMWEIGKNSPGYDMLLRLSQFFGVSVSELAGEEAGNSRIPVLGKVQAGIPRTAVEDIIGYEEISPDMQKMGEFFALRIKGDSMEPRMREGDTVIVRRQSSVNNGEIAIVLVGNEEATCKKFYRLADGVSLVSINPRYAPMFFSKKDIEEKGMEILGKVFELRARF